MASGVKKKVLILSGSLGKGHQRVAEVIHETLQSRGENTEPIVIDYLMLTHAFIYPLIQFLYTKGLERFPGIYGYLFQKTRTVNISHNLIFKRWFPPSLGMGRLWKLLQEIQPSVIVSTFPFAAREMSRLKACGLLHSPLVTVITDYTDHGFWIHPYTDQYIVGSNQVHKALTRKGIANTKISDVGIPVDPKFNQSYSRVKLSAKYGMDPNIPTVLVMGGGYGMIANGQGLPTVQALNHLPNKIQLIIVCGYNTKLQQQVSHGLRQSKHHILITGYVDYIHELMAISDLIITKPGGITSSEALVMGLPMLIYGPLPGQEDDNERFLMEAGVALKAENLPDLTAKLVYLLQNEKQLQMLKANTKRLQPRGSALDVIDVIMNIKHGDPCQKFAIGQSNDHIF